MLWALVFWIVYGVGSTLFVVYLFKLARSVAVGQADKGQGTPPSTATDQAGSTTQTGAQTETPARVKTAQEHGEGTPVRRLAWLGARHESALTMTGAARASASAPSVKMHAPERDNSARAGKFL